MPSRSAAQARRAREETQVLADRHGATKATVLAERSRRRAALLYVLELAPVVKDQYQTIVQEAFPSCKAEECGSCKCDECARMRILCTCCRCARLKQRRARLTRLRNLARPDMNIGSFLACYDAFEDGVERAKTALRPKLQHLEIVRTALDSI